MVKLLMVSALHVKEAMAATLHDGQKVQIYDTPIAQGGLRTKRCTVKTNTTRRDARNISGADSKTMMFDNIPMLVPPSLMICLIEQLSAVSN